MNPAARLGLSVLLGTIGIGVGAPLGALGGALVGLPGGTFGVFFGLVVGGILGAGYGAGFGVDLAAALLAEASVSVGNGQAAVTGGCIGSGIGAIVSLILFLALPRQGANWTTSEFLLRAAPMPIGALFGALLQGGRGGAAFTTTVAPTGDGRGLAFILEGRF